MKKYVSCLALGLICHVPFIHRHRCQTFFCLYFVSYFLFLCSCLIRYQKKISILFLLKNKKKKKNMSSANSKLIENLETQLKRLVTELKDLDECRYNILFDKKFFNVLGKSINFFSIETSYPKMNLT